MIANLQLLEKRDKEILVKRRREDLFSEEGEESKKVKSKERNKDEVGNGRNESKRWTE